MARAHWNSRRAARTKRVVCVVRLMFVRETTERRQRRVLNAQNRLQRICPSLDAVAVYYTGVCCFVGGGTTTAYRSMMKKTMGGYGDINISPFNTPGRWPCHQ